MTKEYRFTPTRIPYQFHTVLFYIFSLLVSGESIGQNTNESTLLLNRKSDSTISTHLPDYPVNVYLNDGSRYRGILRLEEEIMILKYRERGIIKEKIIDQKDLLWIDKGNKNHRYVIDPSKDIVVKTNEDKRYRGKPNIDGNKLYVGKHEVPLENIEWIKGKAKVGLGRNIMGSILRIAGGIVIVGVGAVNIFAIAWQVDEPVNVILVSTGIVAGCLLLMQQGERITGVRKFDSNEWQIHIK